MCTECFQLVAVHLPKTLEQEVEVTELSVVFCDISPNPRSTAFGREVRCSSEKVYDKVGEQMLAFYSSRNGCVADGGAPVDVQEPFVSLVTTSCSSVYFLSLKCRTDQQWNRKPQRR